MRKSRAALIIMLSAIVLLSVSACEKKSIADSLDTEFQSGESVIDSEPESSDELNPPETSATIPSCPEPSADPVSPFENFSFDLSGDQTSLYDRKMHISYGTNRVFFYGKDFVLSTPGRPLEREEIFDYYRDDYDISCFEQYSIDGMYAAAIVIWDGNSTGKLVYCDGKSIVTISENVDTFCLSADGSHLAYLTGIYEHGVGGDLYLYNAQSKESELIAESAGRLFVLSPSGQSISYTQFYRQYDPDSLLCYARTGTEAAIEVGKDLYCIAISDDAQTIFCLKREQSIYELYVYQDWIEKVLCDSLPLEGPTVETYSDDFGPAFTMNNDCTQIVYSDSDSTWFYVRGEEPVKVIDSGNTLLMGKSSIIGIVPNTLNATYYQERILTDFARSVCSISFSGTPNLCNVLFETESELGLFDEYLIPYTFSIPEDFDAAQDEFGTLVLSSYKSNDLKINPHLKESWLLEADQYLGKTEDGRLFFVRENTLYSLGTDGAEVKVADLTGAAVPYCTPYLEKIFILENQNDDFFFDDQNPEETAFFYSLYVIDLDSPTELRLVSEKVARYTLEINGSEIIFAKYTPSKEESTIGSSCTVNLKVYYSSDGEDFEYITTYPQGFYIMGG